MDTNLLKVLDNLNIDYKVIEHEAASTIDEVKSHWTTLEGIHCKNLFLRDKKGRKHYLVVAEASKTVPIGVLNDMLGNNERLGFASERRLEKYLGLKPGSVTPFGVVNDQDNHVTLLLDEAIKEAEMVSFHPNVNTATLSLSYTDFEKFLNWSGNTYQFVKL